MATLGFGSVDSHSSDLWVGGANSRLPYGQNLVRAAAITLFVAILVSGAARATQTHEIQIREYRYEPARLKIKQGDSVQWTNQEKRVSHSILFTGVGGFESERIFPGESWRRTFAAPGSYPYSCGPHPEMKGVVDVE